MKIINFPRKNRYFNFGLESWLELHIPCKANLSNVVIVSLSHWSLKEVLSCSWIEKPGPVKLIIIYHEQLLPLAKYYQINNENIIAICSEWESLSFINYLLHNFSDEERIVVFEGPHLTKNEFFSLRYVSKGISANEQARLMGLSGKTAFAFRYTLGKKLQVKKLSHLFRT